MTTKTSTKTSTATNQQDRQGVIYKVRSSATRAAKQDGHSLENVEIHEVEGGFAYTLATPPEMEEREPAPVMQDVTDPAVIAQVKAEAEAKEEKEQDGLNHDEELRRQELNAPPTSELAKPPADEKPAPAPKPSMKGKSSVEGPTKMVWEIADTLTQELPGFFDAQGNPSATPVELPKHFRKQVMDAAKAKGITHFTARTQYQQWSAARRESISNAAKANKKS